MFSVGSHESDDHSDEDTIYDDRPHKGRAPDARIRTTRERRTDEPCDKSEWQGDEESFPQRSE